MNSMVYHKDKHLAFQDAQQSVLDAQELHQGIVKDSASYGQQLKHLKQEVNEAYAQIENALEVSSETQRLRLQQFRDDLSTIVTELNQTE